MHKYVITWHADEPDKFVVTCQDFDVEHEQLTPTRQVHVAEGWRAARLYVHTEYPGGRCMSRIHSQAAKVEVWL